MSRLQPLNLVDFTGGLVARRSQFTLGDNESPDMLNIEVDPRSGIFTRRGWERWNPDDAEIVSDPLGWDPRMAKLHPLSEGDAFQVYVASSRKPTLPNQGYVYTAGPNGDFGTDAPLLDTGGSPVDGFARPHLFDFAAWGDTMYLATGSDAANSYARPGAGAAIQLIDAYNNWTEYTNPLGGRFPVAEFCEVHSGYMFVAGTDEGSYQPNRLRWSHPGRPEDWANLDYIDIERGGARITGLLSFRDHLLIFKTDSVWALYGYDSDSWQLVQVSMSVGCPSVTAFTRSETAVYFFSLSDNNGIYAYAGGSPVYLTEKLQSLIGPMQPSSEIYVSWLSKRLWCVLPIPVVYRGELYPNTVFAFDPNVGGDGAWTRHCAAVGSMGPPVERSDTNAALPLITIKGDSGNAIVAQMEFRDGAADRFAAVNAQAVDEGAIGFPAYYRTGWKHAGWPERRKSWLRPRAVVANRSDPADLRVNVFWDYNENEVRRSFTVRVNPTTGAVQWGSIGPGGLPYVWSEEGADFVDPGTGQAGLDWGARGGGGGYIGRSPKNLGVCRAVQIEMSTDSNSFGLAWGVDAFIAKYNLRRFTT